MARQITAGEFEEAFLNEDIQVREGGALTSTIQMLLPEYPDLMKGKTLMCKVDNQVLKAVLERKGTTSNLAKAGIFFCCNIGDSCMWL